MWQLITRQSQLPFTMKGHQRTIFKPPNGKLSERKKKKTLAGKCSQVTAITAALEELWTQGSPLRPWCRWTKSQRNIFFFKFKVQLNSDRLSKVNVSLNQFRKEIHMYYISSIYFCYVWWRLFGFMVMKTLLPMSVCDGSRSSDSSCGPWNSCMLFPSQSFQGFNYSHCLCNSFYPALFQPLSFYWVCSRKACYKQPAYFRKISTAVWCITVKLAFFTMIGNTIIWQ